MGLSALDLFGDCDIMPNPSEHRNRREFFQFFWPFLALGARLLRSDTGAAMAVGIYGYLSI
jgi:hypothetical protein